MVAVGGAARTEIPARGQRCEDWDTGENDSFVPQCFPMEGKFTVLFPGCCLPGSAFVPPVRGITCDQHRRSPSPQNPGLTSGSSNEGK